MIALTSEQLAELRQAIVERLQEFEIPSGKLPSLGVVRMAYEIIAPFVRGQVTPPHVVGDDYAPQKDAQKHSDGNQAKMAELYQELEKRKAEHILTEDEADVINRHNRVPGYRPGEEFGKPLTIAGANEAGIAATLGPEHTLVTPLRNGRPPDPDVARERVAHALSNGSGGALATMVGRRPRTLAEVDEDKGRTMPRGAYIPSERELIKELQRQAMAGVMPSVESFNASRPAGWSKAMAHMVRLDRTWHDLATLAGLKPNPRTPRRGGRE